MEKRENPELEDLGTHQAGAVKLHETRKTNRPIHIKPGRAPGAKSEKVD